MSTQEFKKGTRYVSRHAQTVVVLGTEEIGKFTLYRLRSEDGTEFKATEEAMRKLFRPETEAEAAQRRKS